MPTDEDRDAQLGSGENPPANEPAPAGAPSFSLDDVRTLVSESVRSTVGEMMNGLRQPVAQPRREDPEPDLPTDEEYRDNPVAATAKVVAKALHPIRKEMGAFREFGLSRLATLTEDVVGQKLPHYATYKKEIDARMATLDPALRSDPTTLRLVHDTVAMEHEQERMQKARDEGIRQGRGEAPAPGNNGRAAGKGSEPGVPTPTELGFSAEQIDEIEQRGGPDAFARRISNGRFNGWKEYVASRTSMTTGPKQRGLPVIPFLRTEPRRFKAPESK